MLIVKFTKSSFNKIWSRIPITSFLAIAGILSGAVLEVSYQPKTFAISAAAYAQDYTIEETINYAKAGYEVELLRQKVYKEIKNIINEPPPNIVCNQQETLNNLSDEVRTIAENYCNESRQIVKDHNLTIDRFNELKKYYDRGDEFYQQVQNILLDLQNK
ncbi:MAG: hypothetical protein Tsb0014_24950 [Pleurocapsa sp.]